MAMAAMIPAGHAFEAAPALKAQICKLCICRVTVARCAYGQNSRGGVPAPRPWGQGIGKEWRSTWRLGRHRHAPRPRRSPPKGERTMTHGSRRHDRGAIMPGVTEELEARR